MPGGSRWASRSAAATRSTTRGCSTPDPARGSRLLIDRLFPQVRLSTLTGSVLRDSRNDVLDPERGTVPASTARRCRGARSGSEVGFVKTFVQGFIYRRLPGTARSFIATARSASRWFRAKVDGLRRPADLGPDGEPWSTSPICRRASASSQAAIRPCAASCSIGWYRGDAEQIGVSHWRQRHDRGQRGAEDALLEGTGRRRLRRCRQRFPTRQ